MSTRGNTRLCTHCQTARAVLKRPKNLEQLCRECFYTVFEDEVHQTIINEGLFTRGERVAVAASGGKDSTVLAHTLTTLNKRYDYGLDLFLLSIDEGITGYRDDSLETVKRNEATYGIPLLVVSYQQLYGWTMDEIVGQIGTRNNCTFCGVFRRQALDRGAVIAKANKVATGHNADDVAETVLLNLLRGDVARLSRCASAITGGDEVGGLTRVKPFKYSYEKEIVMYAYFKRLDYFSTECLYAPFAARGFARDFVKDLEAARPTAVLDLIRSAENFRFPSQQKPPAADGARSSSGTSSSGSSTVRQAGPTARQCERCGYISSQHVCKACVMLEGLNKGRPGGLAPTIARTHADFEHQRQPPTATTGATTSAAEPSRDSAAPTASSTTPGLNAAPGAQQARSQITCTAERPAHGDTLTASSHARGQPSQSSPSAQTHPSSSRAAGGAPAAAADNSCTSHAAGSPTPAHSLRGAPPAGAAPAAADGAPCAPSAAQAASAPSASSTGGCHCGAQLGDAQQSSSGDGQLKGHQQSASHVVDQGPSSQPHTHDLHPGSSSIAAAAPDEGSSSHKLANGAHPTSSHYPHTSLSAASWADSSTRGSAAPGHGQATVEKGMGSTGRAKQVVIEYEERSV